MKKFSGRKILATVFAASAMGVAGVAVGTSVTGAPNQIPSSTTTTAPAITTTDSLPPLPTSYKALPVPKKKKLHSKKTRRKKDKKAPKENKKKIIVSGDNYYYALGSYESSGNHYYVVNTIGCAGRWQFCPTSIGGPGWGKYDGNLKGWLKDHAYQDQFMTLYTKHHWDAIVQLDLDKYLCKTRVSAHGVHYTLTQGGMLAGAHLGGVYGLEEYLVNKDDNHDDYGTYISDYLAKYQDTYIPNTWGATRGNSLAGCQDPSLSPLFNWAVRQLGKKNDPWAAGWSLKFTDDGMQAVGMTPLRKPSAAAAWNTYKVMGKAHKWGSKGLRKGDLVFWDANAGGLSATGHVAIYAGNNMVIDDFGGVIRKDKIKFITPRHTAPSGFVHPT